MLSHLFPLEGFLSLLNLTVMEVLPGMAEGVHVVPIQIPKGFICFVIAFSFGVKLLILEFKKKQACRAEKKHARRIQLI